ncbi:uncharacterized protein KY384_001026 [Bacidia gigantensis]|uniref:uncharacterized protein n=1 Tax=Bacidia gigantensis TaxID=2732470 RepID=UPI001D059F40|nr:uncharacterized protein KY384_001026 [Bacidia gigantensis]KAG8534182.1 hypothetical protein KY384_001026 [Bacidia gigantensis]
MSTGEALVDLSLFSASPTDDRQFAVHGRSDDYDLLGLIQEPFQPTREFYAPRAPLQALSEQSTSKPLPRLPPRTICGAIQIPREREGGCVLHRMKRKRTNESPGTPDLSLPQRRNIQSPPQLTLSIAGRSVTERGPASELVWMPEEQMWLLLGEEGGVGNREPERGPVPHQESTQHIPQPQRSRSEPATSAQSQWRITPPLSPVQTQLQRLMQQPRDEERLSPLFQEAMNSVPMEDLFDSPPAYETVHNNRSALSTPGISTFGRADGTSTATAAPRPPHATSSDSRRAPLTRAISFGSTYTTAASHLSSSDSASLFSRSQYDGDVRTPLKPVTSKFGTWTPNMTSNYTTHIWSPNAPNSRKNMSDGQGNVMDFLNSDPAEGKSKSWHGFARKFTRPKSAA